MNKFAILEEIKYKNFIVKCIPWILRFLGWESRIVEFFKYS